MEIAVTARAMLSTLVLFFLCSAAPTLSAHTYGKPARGYWDPLLSPVEEEAPTFEDTPTHVPALVGQNAILPCHVAHLGDRVVSWIRTRDLSILTSGGFSFTSDKRFDVLNKPGTTAWDLRIQSAQPADEGKYECQVNTDPKMNRAVFLTVRGDDWLEDRPYMANDGGEASVASGGVKQARVLGAAEQFVSVGSTVTFTCLVAAPYPRGYPPHSVTWLHRGYPISIQAVRGGISLDTVTTDAQTTSRLTVAAVGADDAGNYTCAPGSGVAPASVALVVTDERTEAMQRDGPHSGAPRARHMAALLCIMATWCRLVT